MTRQRSNHRQYRPRPSSKTRFWYIGKRNKNNEIIGLLLFLVLFCGGIWTSLSQTARALLVVLFIYLVVIVFIIVFGVVGFLAYRRNRRLRSLSIAQVDAMNGHQFEHYVAALLGHQGYSHIQVTQASGDYGVDVLATKDGQRWAIQAKHYSGMLGQEPIREVFTGCAYYQCMRGMVVTTSHFTQAAKKLAASSNVTLVDRDKLADWIITFQQEREKTSARPSI